MLKSIYAKYPWWPLNPEEHNALKHLCLQQRAGIHYVGICVLHIYQRDSRRQGCRGSNITTYSLMAYTAMDHYPSQHLTAQHSTALQRTMPHSNPLSLSITLDWLHCEVCRRLIGFLFPQRHSPNLGTAFFFSFFLFLPFFLFFLQWSFVNLTFWKQ